MFEAEGNSQATFSKIVVGREDDIIDALLSVLKSDRWEDLKMHYENGTLSAGRTELRFHTFEGEKEEVPVTFVLNASWLAAEDEVEIMVEVSEPEYDWTQDECATICDSILIALKNTFGVIDPESNGNGNGHGH